MHAFKLYTGEDNASHVLEGTLTLDQRIVGFGRLPDVLPRRIILQL